MRLYTIESLLRLDFRQLFKKRKIHAVTRLRVLAHLRPHTVAKEN